MQAPDVFSLAPGSPYIFRAQSITLPDLSQLPPWAVISFGISLAVIVGMGWWGERQGRKAPAAGSAGQAQVVAVTVDPSALNAAAAAVDGLTVAVHHLVVALNAANVTANRTAEELDAVREEMRIHREVSRR